MKKLIIFLILTHTLFSYVTSAEEGFHKEMPKEVPFQVGEKLTYVVKMWGVAVGRVTASVVEKVQVNGREAYHIVVLVRSTGFTARLYRLQDELHSYVDTQTLELLKAERFLQEGGIKSYVEINLDPDNNRGTFFRETSGKPTVNNKIKIEPLTLDATSLTYYVRGNGVDGIRNFDLNVLYEDRVKNIEVARMEDEEIDLGKGGRFQTQVYKQIKGGDIILWLSDDSRKIPVKIVALSLKIVDWRIVDILGYLTNVEN